MIPQISNLQMLQDYAKINSECQIIVDILLQTQLSYALTTTVVVPSPLVNLAYSSATSPDPANDNSFSFEITNKVRVTITLREFRHIFRLPEPASTVTPTTFELAQMLNDMGHTPPLSTKFSDQKKSKLPLVWNWMYHILIRCLTGKTGGLDSLNATQLGMLYALYKGMEFDFGRIIWDEFTSTIKHKKCGTEIACHRFWAILVHFVYRSKRLPMELVNNALPIHQLHFFPSIPHQGVFEFVGKIPQVMLDLLPDEHILKRAYVLSVQDLPNVRSFPEDFQLNFTEKVGRKRKATEGEISKPVEKKKKTKVIRKRKQVIETSEPEDVPSETSEERNQREYEEEIARNEEAARLEAVEKKKEEENARLAEVEKKKKEAEEAEKLALLQKQQEEARIRFEELEKKKKEAEEAAKLESLRKAAEEEKKRKHEEEIKQKELERLEAEAKEKEEERLKEEEFKRKAEEEAKRKHDEEANVHSPEHNSTHDSTHDEEENFEGNVDFNLGGFESDASEEDNESWTFTREKFHRLYRRLNSILSNMVKPAESSSTHFEEIKELITKLPSTSVDYKII